MPKMTVELTTNEHGFFTKTVPINPPGPFKVTVKISATLVSPFATGLWGSLDIDAKDGNPSNPRRSFIVWHKEAVQLGSWKLDGGNNIVVVHGITKPRRRNAKLVLEIDASL